MCLGALLLAFCAATQAFVVVLHAVLYIIAGIVLCVPLRA